MYLEKINNKWSAFIQSSGFKETIRITNTTKLNVIARLYMLEYLYNEKRYHLYHILGETTYELRVLNETYDQTSFEAVFRINAEKSKEYIEAVNGFMSQIYAGIQTSVDCSEGLEKAKKEIQNVRLYT